MEHIRYTAAPERYDGFGTRTLEASGLVHTRSGNAVRKVSILDKHLYWQEMRYGSGLFPSWQQGDLSLVLRTGEVRQ